GDPPEPQEKWERVDKKRSGSNKLKQERPPRVEIDLDAADLLGTETQRTRARNRVRDAASAFAAERFEDARRILKPMSSEQAHISDIRELYGLTLYRLGRWAEAIAELEVAAAMTGSSEQHPVRADAHRALGQHRAVADLWEELRQDHPDADVITEGRIVMAGSRADQGDLAGAIRILEQGPIRTKSPKDHHLRLWYALADMYERSGDSQRARRGFERVEATDRGFADVGARLRSMQ
ncbi:MAG: tetratricopeptide repeat protein, partial [Actinobacteria bacterium]|nr:tetratricopeptide repeat protein [Actinomycetota bacterium]